MSKVKAGVACAVLVGGMMTANAADLAYTTPPPPLSLPRFYIHAGPAGLFYTEKAKIQVGGVLQPGATVNVNDAATFAIEAGYFITPNIAASVTMGFPPMSTIDGSGTFAAVGVLGKSRGGPSGLSIHYHVTDWGRFQPYIGGGIAALVIFNTEDGVMQDLKVKHAVGFMAQIGFDYMIDQNWGVFFDVKKSLLKTTATGLFGGMPVNAKVTLDPLVIHTGLTYRF